MLRNMHSKRPTEADPRRNAGSPEWVRRVEFGVLPERAFALDAIGHADRSLTCTGLRNEKGARTTLRAPFRWTRTPTLVTLQWTDTWTCPTP